MLARELAFDNAVDVISVCLKAVVAMLLPDCLAHMSPTLLLHLQDQEVVVFKTDAEFTSAYDTVFGCQSTQEQVYVQVQREWDWDSA